jgi:hypothetical protein
MFACDLSLVSEVFVHKNKDGGDDTEKTTETKHDKVSYSFRERGLSSKEGFLSLVDGEGWEFHFEFRHLHFLEKIFLGDCKGDSKIMKAIREKELGGSTFG